MNNRQRWAVAIGALLLAAVVGAIAFNLGVNAGADDSGGRPYPYHWRPWGFGFFLIPLFFIAFWLLFARGAWHRGCGYGYESRLDDWHRRAHERMGHGEQDHPDRRR